MDIANLVTPIVKFSYDALEDIPHPFDLLFIDGAHEYEAVKNDFDMWSTMLKEGGIIAFHDSVGNSWKDVAKVVEDNVYFSRHFKNVKFVGSITYATKVTENTTYDRIRSRMVYVLKYLQGVKKHMPKPIRKIEHYVVEKCFQRSWIRQEQQLLLDQV